MKQKSLYALRWVLDYHNKPTKYGLWSTPSTDPNYRPDLISHEGLLEARIELLDKEKGGIVKAMAGCPAQDFCCFMWESGVAMNLFRGPHRQFIIGLSILSRDEKATVFIDGRTRVSHRNDIHDHLMNYGKNDTGKGKK